MVVMVVTSTAEIPALHVEFLLPKQLRGPKIGTATRQFPETPQCMELEALMRLPCCIAAYP